MHAVYTLMLRELRGYFDSLTAYILLTLFLSLSGFFTWTFGSTVFFINQASLQVFFSVSFWTLFFFIPALTMRSLAEEQRTGTLELLCTKPMSHLDIVLGKFFAAVALVLLALLCTLPYYITITWLGSIDQGAVLGGYLALFMLTLTYCALGVFASALSDNQIVSFLIALALASLFHIIFGLMGSSLVGNPLGSLFRFLSLTTHYEPMSRGVIDLRDVLYFVSLSAGFIYFSRVCLDKRKW